MAFDADLAAPSGRERRDHRGAREPRYAVTHRTFIVRRDGPNGELLATPKTEDELSETGSEKDD